MISISIICWVLAAACNAAMDKMKHHYKTSIFSSWDPQYWNPDISWRNKYKNHRRSQGPAFFLSTGILVAFTDAWHLFKSIMIVLLTLSVITFPYTYRLCLFDNLYLNLLCWLVILGTLWNCVFSLLYNKVLKK